MTQRVRPASLVADEGAGLNEHIHHVVVLVMTETIWCGGDGRSSGEAQLVEFSHSGSSQPFPEHGRRQPHDPQTTPDAAGESEGAHAGGGAADRGGQ